MRFVVAAAVVLSTCSDFGPDLPSVASLDLSTTDAHLAVGDSLVLIATPIDKNGRRISSVRVIVGWSSSDTGIATVNATTGLLIARAPGVATVYASARGKTAPVHVTVAARTP